MEIVFLKDRDLDDIRSKKDVLMMKVKGNYSLERGFSAVSDAKFTGSDSHLIINNGTSRYKIRASARPREHVPEVLLEVSIFKKSFAMDREAEGRFYDLLVESYQAKMIDAEAFLAEVKQLNTSYDEFYKKEEEKHDFQIGWKGAGKGVIVGAALYAIADFAPGYLAETMMISGGLGGFLQDYSAIMALKKSIKTAARDNAAKMLESYKDLESRLRAT